MEDYRNKIASYDVRLAIQQKRVDHGLLIAGELNPIRIEKIQALQNQVNAKASALVDLVSLYKALGGGY